MCVCVSYAQEEIVTCTGEDEKRDHILIPVTDSTMDHLHLKEIPFLFTRKKEEWRYQVPPHTRQLVTQNEIARELLKYKTAPKTQKHVWRFGLLLTVEKTLKGPTEEPCGYTSAGAHPAL